MTIYLLPSDMGSRTLFGGFFVTISGRCMLLCIEFVVAEDYPYLSMQHITF